MGPHEELDLPDKADADQQYFALSGAVISSAIVTDLFGVNPPRGDGPPQPTTLLRNASESRGFAGTLRHVLIRGAMYTVTSDAITGLSAVREPC